MTVEESTPEQSEVEQPDKKEVPRRKRIWRRVRRTCYVLVFLAVAVPVTAFVICYSMWDVPDPADVAAGQNQTITLYYSDGTTELGRIIPASGNRTSVRFQDIPEHVQHAVLAAEDKSFWDNDGFNLAGIVRSAWNNLTGFTGGGSTITQQYIKKATGDDKHSLGRKWRELVLAKKMSDTYTKQDLLTAYLNTVYFGRGANGIQAAARAYFGKDVQQVNVAEAALLAGVIQRPTYWDPDVDRDNAERRWNFVLDQMVDDGWLTRADRAATKFPATLPRDAGQSSAELQIQNQVLAELEERADLPRDEGHQIGYKVVTTIDRATQQSTERATDAVMAGQPDYLRTAVVSVDPNTGGVVAYSGGGNGRGLDYAQTLQEPGTTFGPFVGVAAMLDGMRPDQPVNGWSPQTIGGIPMQNPAGVTCSPCSLRKAMAKPVNTAIASVALRTGTQKVVDAAVQLGIPQELHGKPTMTAKPGDEPDTRIALGMGSTFVRPIDLATAYATLAADGVRTSTHFVKRVEDGAGNVRYREQLSSQQAIPPKVAWSVTDALSEAGDEAHVKAAIRPGTRPYGDAGANAKAWLAGYTRNLATVVWMGSDQLKPIRNKDGKDITPLAEPAAIWRATMAGYAEVSGR
ncbi:transglycosylase domain-containing protein [Actinocrispum wychmicini]|uniref:Membrane peptidoglycan carboxypeptidase n=1 Tax=Actinocrispum wychmicini TaxID=1213861 RepID=A0A4R2JRP1_9PSEU|nr:transglycosylase domain-containing protein [Actinocrispum wychmicini]TCO56855.1 membrane peptidoglycan carboxypeptidase [Actinocrispum wychmicini]